MRDIIDKRNKLNNYSQRLRTLKFNYDNFNNREKVTELIEEQNKIYKHYMFYKNYIKQISKEKRK